MVLRRGDNGPAVAAVRVTLASLGLIPPEPGADPEDADFDASTDAAVRAFQQQRGLLVDGLVGPVTMGPERRALVAGRPHPELHAVRPDDGRRRHRAADQTAGNGL